MFQKCQQETHPPQQIVMLFDHLVGAGEQRGRQGETERLRGLKVDHELKFRRLLDGYLPWLRPAQNLVNVISDSTPQRGQGWSIGYEASRFSVFPVIANGRQPRIQSQAVNLHAIAENQRISNDRKSVYSVLEGLESDSNILGSMDLECKCLLTAPASGCLYLVHLKHGAGTANIGDDRQPAQAGYSLM